MKLLIIQLSDFHFDSKNNILMKRQEKILEAVRNKALDVDMIFMAITGDLANTGAEEEYKQVAAFLDYLSANLEKYTRKKIHIMLSPGNHDVNFNSKKIKIREKLIEDIKKEGHGEVEEDFIEQICEAQKDYFNFTKGYLNSSSLIYSSNLLNVYKYEFMQREVVFYIYNTSWMSQIHEQQGTLVYPIKNIKNDFKSNKGDLIIAMLHHPFHWYNSQNKYEFQTHCIQTSDIILSGHEHVSGKSILHDLKSLYTEYVEGDVLQDRENMGNSGFNTIHIDLKESTHKIENYKFTNEIYDIKESTEWLPFLRSKHLVKQSFIINDEFKKYLDDAGAKYYHPRKTHLLLPDIYIYPNMKNIQEEDFEKNLYGISNSLNILSNLKKMKLLIIGGEKYGKTSFCKMVYKYYYAKDLIPILIDGSKITTTKLDNFHKLVENSFEMQYDKEKKEQFNQLSKEKKVIIIDDFNKIKLNIKYRTKFVDTIEKHYPNIIVTANELFQIEKLSYEREKGNIIFKDYYQFQLLEFGHQLRRALIEKWNILGQEETLEDYEFTRINDYASNILDTIIGKNYVPSLPIYIIIILQTIEAGKPYEMRDSGYGYYYQYLIIESLKNNVNKKDEIDPFFSYLSELAFYMFDKSIKEISRESLLEFHNWYCYKEYKVSSSLEIILNVDKLLEVLQKSSMLFASGGSYSFRYKYIYYYFVAKYLSDKNNESKSKIIIPKLAQRIYIEEFANIIMFLTHHSKDPLVLNEILENAKQILNKNSYVEFENDIKEINDLMKIVPQMVYEESDIRKNREKILKLQDEIEWENEAENEGDEDEDYDLEGEIPTLDTLSEMTLAFKSIEIIGQILKNYFGSLKAAIRKELGEEAYKLGLRTLSVFFVLLKDNKDKLVEEISNLIDREKTKERDEVENIAKKILFSFCILSSYGIIKRISSSIGHEHLSETFKDILSENDKSSFHLIDFAIKLDYYKYFPFSDLDGLAKRFDNNILPKILMQQLVLNYLYMFPTLDKDKQKICAKTGITMDTQRLIDLSSSDKKLK